MADDFYWEQRWSDEGFHSYNYDRTRGKVEIKWFEDATTNICYNCLDRNISKGLGGQIAFYWEGNDPADHTAITYQQLLERVCRFANALKAKGVKKGDPVAIYQPMILDLVVAMLATARIGAIHSIVFGGFSALALSDRILDSQCRVLITAGKAQDLKSSSQERGEKEEGDNKRKRSTQGKNGKAIESLSEKDGSVEGEERASVLRSKMAVDKKPLLSSHRSLSLFLPTPDGVYRGSKYINLKEIADEAVRLCYER